ncbi:Exodeoxyribonuclease I [Vibrio chagasii]|nr:Exodeoxyribonuclease I [Vibrio chagasii]
MAINFVFHDYETFGKETQGASSQWAAVRTDENFKTLETHNVFCKITDDVVPDPEACMVTKVTPQVTLEKGMPEYEFAHYINNVFTAKWETVCVGYNSIGFDDEVSRHLLYRNLIDPYKWAYDKKNTRFDALPLMRIIHALKPECFNWPVVDKVLDTGETVKRISFKLEHLSAENGIVHENAHDALSDVYALAEVMKLAKERAPEIFNQFFQLKNKWNVKNLVEGDKPMLGLCNFRFVDSNYISPVSVLGVSTKSANKYYTWNLQVDPRPFAEMSKERLAEVITFNKEQRDAEGTPRSGMVSVKINEVPFIFDVSELKGEPLSRAGLTERRNEMFENGLFLANNPEFKQMLREVYDERQYEERAVDTDTSLYDQTHGGFFTDLEKPFIESFKNAITWAEKANIMETTPDGRICEMMFRIIGRNSVGDLENGAVNEKWRDYLRSRILDGSTPNAFVTLSQLKETLSSDEFLEKFTGDEVNEKVIADLTAYVDVLNARVTA